MKPLTDEDVEAYKKVFSGCLGALLADMIQVKRERDAAIGDLKEHIGDIDCCCYCKYMAIKPDPQNCPVCENGDKWEWRGLDERK